MLLTNRQRLECEIGIGKLNRLQTAKKRKEIEVIDKQLKTNRDKELKSITKRVIEMYMDFEKLCFNLSKADKLNKVNDFKQMSTLAFYTYKNNLQEYLKPNPTEAED